MMVQGATSNTAADLTANSGLALSKDILLIHIMVKVQSFMFMMK